MAHPSEELPRRIQVPVRKQGSFSTTNWSSRILTIDPETATVTISRSGHPNNVLYHSLIVKAVEMWPRYAPEEIDDADTSVKAMLTLRIVGQETSVPFFDLNDAVKVPGDDVSGTTSMDTSATVSATTRANSSASDYAYMRGNDRKKSRPLAFGGATNFYEAWMIRFTSFAAYEMALRTLAGLHRVAKNQRPLFGENFEADLMNVREGLETYLKARRAQEKK